MQISAEWNISKQWLMVHCVVGSLEYKMSNNVAMATLSGGTATAKRREKILIVGNWLARKITNCCRLTSASLDVQLFRLVQGTPWATC